MEVLCVLALSGPFTDKMSFFSSLFPSFSYAIVKRTPEEIKAQKVAREKKMQEKAARRKAQEVNVAKKKAEREAAKEAHRIATGGAPRKANDDEGGDSDNDDQDAGAKRKRGGDDDDDDGEDGYGDESEDNYSDMGDMAPQFSDDDEAFSGEDHDQMEGLSDEDDLE